MTEAEEEVVIHDRIHSGVIKPLKKYVPTENRYMTACLTTPRLHPAWAVSPEQPCRS